MTEIDRVIANLRELLERPRIFWATATFLALAFVALAYFTRAPGILTGGDDAIYMMLAESLGQGSYRDLMILGAPYHTTYPPVFPAWILLLSVVGMGSVDAVVLVNCVLVAVALLLIADVVRNKWGAGVAVTVLAVSVVNPQVLHWTGTALSEAPYLALSSLALWAVTKEERWQGSVVAGAAAVATVMTRSIGVTLLVSVVLVWALHGHWKRVVRVGVVGALVMGAWLIWTNVAPTPNTYSVMLAVGSQEAGGGLLSTVAVYVSQNVGRYFPGALFYALQYPTVEETLADNVAWLLFTLAVGIPGIINAWKKWPTMACYLVAYFLVIVAWPWQANRLFVPVVPFTLVVLMVGTLDVARRLGRPTLGVAGVALLVVILAASSLAKVATTVAEVRACDRGLLHGERSCFKPSDQAFFEAASYAGATLPSDAVVGVHKGPSFAWYADLRVAPYWMFTPEGDGTIPEALQSGDVQYVLLAQVSAFEWRTARALHGVCDRFEVVETFPHHTLLLRFVPEPATRTNNSCPAIDDYLRSSPPGD